ncbi:MAG: ribonuclease PH [Desulfocapsaceae bacterium]|jgi:ribonuclease PH|nr:ribonuclease PH [Desulfocapsaceae bacterium]
MEPEKTTRSNNRPFDSLRPFSLRRNIQPQAGASLLMRAGNTEVICAVTIEEGVPPFLEGKNQGWITAEYGMLPCATGSRYRRETSGRAARSQEIQRLIGRSLRMMVDLQQLGPYTLRVDCDVLNADGGTRTAAITGSAIALRDALCTMEQAGMIRTLPTILPLAAVSVGIIGEQTLLDLDYVEDSGADADGNFVMDNQGRWLEIQATAEKAPLEDHQFEQMKKLARKGIRELLELWSS